MTRADSAKSPALYLTILAVWAALIAVSVPGFYFAAERLDGIGTALAAVSELFIAYFWLNGIKDLVYTLWYHIRLKGKLSVPVRRNAESGVPRVVLVYCTANDFNAESLEACLFQSYLNYEVVILDDSLNPDYKARVDAFAQLHGLTVVRREGRVGFKAGNLNNYLANNSLWDYFVILDSDEIIPANFVDRCLDYFAADPTVGIVQANHVATRDRNHFMEQYSMGVDSHWIAYQSVKIRSGFLSLLGHGALVSRKCYNAASGFPHVVAEDLCFTIAARNQGYLAVFAPDVICQEEYPVDYAAFRKRHNKWTQGNMEFIKRYTGTILRSSMRWFEKLDIVLFTYALPLTAVFSLYVVANVVVLPLMGERILLPKWMLIPTVLFLLAPMLNDFISHRDEGVKRLASYSAHSMLLYGSMFWTSLRASIKSMFGQSVFLVTPKDTAWVGFRGAIKACRTELVFFLALAAVTMYTTGSIFPTVLIAMPALFSVYLVAMHNSERPYRGGRHSAKRARQLTKA